MSVSMPEWERKKFTAGGRYGYGYAIWLFIMNGVLWLLGSSVCITTIIDIPLLSD